MKILDPLKDGVSSLELLRSSGRDLDVVNAARVCYGKESEDFSEKDEKLLRYLLVHRHTSPFEHTHLVYRVRTPLFVVRQWMRHRIGVSYNEVSGRYTEMPLEFYTPNKWRVADATNKQGSVEATLEKDEETFAAYKRALKTSGDVYNELLANGVCRELARGVLPLCTYTSFIFTCNLVSLFHFLGLRADVHAQWEIQQYANGMRELAKEHFPVSIKAWEELQKK